MNMQSRQHLVALALAVATTCASLAMLSRLLPASRQMLGRAIHQELEHASSETLPLHLDQLEALQADALPALAAALGSDRLDVSQGARRLIDLEIRRWQKLPLRAGSEHIQQLASLLAAHVSEYNATGRAEARELALRILDWPIDRAVVDRTQLIATCELILRTAAQNVPATLVATAPEPADSDSRANIDRVEVIEVGADIPSYVDPTENLAGQDLADRSAADQSGASAFIADVPPPQRPQPPLPPVSRPTPGRLRPPVADDRSKPTLPALDNGGGQVRQEPATFPEVYQPDDTSPQPHISREPRMTYPFEPIPLRRAIVDVPSRDKLHRAETVEVMRWLLEDQVAAMATNELKARGFTEVQVQIARQIVDPDPQVRLKVAGALPSIPRNDPRPWLLWLSRDTDPDVRSATVAILATSPDPALQSRLRELESEETDINVLRVVQRALDQQNRRN